MHDRRTERNEPTEPAPEVYWLHVVPRKRTGETITLLITLLVLFVLLALLVGHPARTFRAPYVVPGHSSLKR